MHDNASIYTANKVQEWFANHGIDVTDWPSYSPNLNSIEHAWKKLKELMATMYPELMKSTSYTEETRTELGEALKVCWNAVPTTFFESLLESMPRRVKACLDAKGWHTKY